MRAEAHKLSKYVRFVVSGELPGRRQVAWQLLSIRLAFFLCLFCYELEGFIVPSLRLLLGDLQGRGKMPFRRLSSRN